MEVDSVAGGAGPSEPPASAHLAAKKPTATGAPRKLVIKAFKGASRAFAGAAKHSGALAARLARHLGGSASSRGALARNTPAALCAEA